MVNTLISRFTSVDKWFISILIVAAFLLFVDLGGRSLWWDEIIYVYIEQQTISEIFATLNRTGDYHDLHPPVYHLMMHYWIKLTGTSDFALRFPSAFFALLSVGLVYATGRELGGRKLARVVTFLTAIAPGALLYLRMARYYAFTYFLAILSTWLFIKLWKSPQRWLWIAYAIVALTMYYTDYLVVSILAGHALFAILQGWYQQRSFLLKFIGLQIIIGLAFLPWVPSLLAQTSAGEVQIADLAFSPIGYALKVAFPFVSFTAGETLFPWEVPAIVSYFIFGVLLLLGVFKKQIASEYKIFLLILFFLPFVGVVAIVSVILPTIPFIGIPNRILFALPYLNFIAALGWLSLQKSWQQTVTLTLIACVAAWGNVNYFREAHFFNPIYIIPAEELATFVSANDQAGDIAWANVDTGFDYYYLRAQGIDSSISELGITFELPDGSAPERIWWVTMGRDRTRHSDDDLKEIKDELASRGYQLVLQEGFVPQDPTYQRVKEALLDRAAYQYKVTLHLYQLESP